MALNQQPERVKATDLRRGLPLATFFLTSGLLWLLWICLKFYVETNGY